MRNPYKQLKGSIFLLLFIASSLVSVSQTHLKVFLISGQSNAVGVGLNSELPVELQGIQTNVKSYTSLQCDASIADKWLPVAPGMGNVLSQHGCELSLAKKLAELYPNDSIAIIKCASGGTILETQWKSPSMGGPTDPDLSKHLFQYFVNTVNKALSSLGSNYTYEIAGMVWMQGESDGMTLDWTSKYEKNLSWFITDLRNTLHAPSMAFIIGKISILSYWPYASEIRQIEDKVATTLPDIGTIDANIYPRSSQDIAHYTSSGLVSMGNDFAIALKSVGERPLKNPWLFNNGTEGWMLSPSLSGTVDSGIYNLTVNGADAYMSSPDSLNIDAVTNGQFDIRLQNQSSGSKFQLFWIRNDDSDWNQEKSMEFNVIPNETRQTDYMAVLRDSPQWKGTIRQIRLNPTDNNTSGNIKLDQISINPFSEFGLDNDTLNIRLDLSRGGAISYISKSRTNRSIVNIADESRYVQQSYYAGNPVDRKAEGQSPSWSPWAWNSKQVGDSHHNRAQILDFKKTGNLLYVKCIPMLWDMNNKPAEAEIEQWTKLEGNILKIKNRLTCHRTDNIYPENILADQELPAVYPISTLKNLYSYFGNAPFTNAPITNPETVHLEDGFWGRYSNGMVSENWMAYVDDNKWGLGVYNPICSGFLAGMAGQPGGEASDGSTSYIAPVKKEILNQNTIYEYEYFLIIDSLESIRSKIYQLHSLGTSSWIPGESGSITGPTSICQGQTDVNYNVSTIADADSYVWTYTSSSPAYFYEITTPINRVTLLIPTDLGSGELTVRGRNHFGDGPKSVLALTLITRPNTPTITRRGSSLYSSSPVGNQWYNSKGIIQGANAQIYTAKVSDVYYVIVSTGGCLNSLASNSINIIFTGIEILENSQNIQIYPNPVCNELTLVCKNCPDEIKFEIINTMGQVVLRSAFTEKKVLQLGINPDGNYVINFRLGKSTFKRKFLKHS